MKRWIISVIMVVLMGLQSAMATINLNLNVASIRDETYRVNFQPEIELPEEIVEAVTSGVLIRMRLDIETRAPTWYGLNRTIEAATVHYDLIYRPLARIYQVRQSGHMAVTVRDLNSGLTELLRQLQYEFAWSRHIDIIRARLEVEIESLPGPMRLTAWVKPVWRHGSGWVKWQP